MLCPASITQDQKNEKHVAYIEVLSTVGTKGYEKYFEDVAKEWIKLDGVPHWHKQFSFLKDAKLFDDSDDTIYDYIYKKYGKKIATFNKVRTGLDLDPHNIFMNTLMETILKPDVIAP